MERVHIKTAHVKLAAGRRLVRNAQRRENEFIYINFFSKGLAMSNKRKLPEPESVNHSKVFMQKILIVALTLIIGLIATVWGITWSASVNRADKTDITIKENTQSINEIKIFVAQQAVINENMLKILEEIKKK